MTIEMQELLSWIDHNQNVLTGRDLDNVADLAEAVGFSPIVVAEWQSCERFRRAG